MKITRSNKNTIKKTFSSMADGDVYIHIAMKVNSSTVVDLDDGHLSCPMESSVVLSFSDKSHLD